MKCKQVKALLPAFDSAELPELEHEMIETHLATCADCSTSLGIYRGLRSQICLLEYVSVDTDIAETTIAKILGQLPPKGPKPGKAPRRRRQPKKQTDKVIGPDFTFGRELHEGNS